MFKKSEDEKLVKPMTKNNNLKSTLNALEVMSVVR